MLKIYYAMSYCLYPFVRCWLFLRVKKGKEDKKRLNERFGKPRLPRPQGTLIWLHAASVGEANSTVPLLQEFHARYPDVNLLVTTGTLTSAKVIRSRLPERAFHQYIPVDFPRSVASFLNHWKPDLAVWVESELWPNLIVHTRRRQIPMALINARMSDKSYKRWLRYRGGFMSLMSCFSLIYAGSAEDKRRYTNLGVRHVKSAGNLKYDAPALPANSKTTSKLLGAIGDRRIWLASSTHPGEEIFIATAHQIIKETFSDVLTIVVPRHAHRGVELIQQLTNQKLTVSCRSKEQVILPETDIYIADTMGELGIFYRLSGVVFIGGSLVPHGGHNPIEPAQLDCALVCGPHMHNFRGIEKEFIDEQALLEVHNIQQLADTVIDLLRDHDKQEQLAKAAHGVAEEKRGVVHHLVKDLAELAQLPAMASNEPVHAVGEG